MKFNKGDFFEISGKEQYKVIFADEEIFVFCPVVKSAISTSSKLVGHPVVNLNVAKVSSNKEEDLKNMYWIKKIGAYKHTLQVSNKL